MIIQQDLNGNIRGKFASLAEASDKTGTKAGDIKRVLKGERNSAGGSKWSVVKSAPVEVGKVKIKTTKKPKSQVGLHIVLPCVHAPFHNKELIKGVNNFIKDLGNKLVGFHIIGDFLDMNSLSAHDKGQVALEGITLGYEYKVGNELLNDFEDVLPKEVEKTYLFGNHEDRYFRHIRQSDNSKYADALLSPIEALKLEERGYQVKTNWKNDYFKLGNHLNLIHGEFCTATPAKTHLTKYKQSCMFGHTHRVDSHYDGNMAAFNIGSLADFNTPAFGYMSRIQKMTWINGFGLVQIDEEGFFHGQVITAFNSQFWYNGKCYK